MGKRGHHIKNLKSEKAKVKFKAGKKLPKGQNITDTSFKVKKIVIKEQLKTLGSEPVSKRHLNIKEILTRLQHYNTNMKLDNLSALKELLTRNQELLSSNTLQILEKLADLIIDKESSVRKEVIPHLIWVIGQIPAVKLTPFVSLICSHMGAALSHINKGIQEDALLLLDGLLSDQHFPALILSASPATHSSSHPFDFIIEGLLNQISDKNDNTDTNKSGWERRLNVNLEAKLADSQKRIKVLQQLRSLLKSALGLRKSLQDHGTATYSPKIIKWTSNVKCDCYVSLSEPSYTSNHRISLPRVSTFDVRNSLSSLEPLANAGKLRDTVTALLPILIGSWKELGPSKASSSYELTLEAADFLKIMLDLLSIITETIMLSEKDSVEVTDLLHWFRSSFCSSIFSILMPAFPFVCSGIKRKKHRKLTHTQRKSQWLIEDAISPDQNIKAEIINEQKYGSKECFDQSLLMASLFCTLEMSNSKEGKKFSSAKHHLEKILSFLADSFADPLNCHHHEKRMSSLIWNLLMSKKTNGAWHLSVDKMSHLINSLVMCCLEECPYTKKSITPCHFFKLLCSILQERTMTELHKLESLEYWIRKLPEMLCFPSNESVKTLCCIARQCNLPIFHDTLKSNLPKLFISLKAESDTEILKDKMGLLHWIQDWDAENLNKIGELVQLYPKETASLVEHLRNKKEHLGENCEFSQQLESTNWWQKRIQSNVNDLWLER